MLNRRSIVSVAASALFVLSAVAAHAAAIPVTQVSPTSTGPIVFPTAAVGGGASTVTAQFLLGVSGTLTITAPVSAGNHQEFVIGTITGCTANGTTQVAAGSTCTVPITFQPYYPGQRSQPLAVTFSGQVYSFGLTGPATGPQARLDPTNITTLIGAAGTTSTTPSPDGVAIASGIVYGPQGLTTDSSNNVYIADNLHGRVRVAYQSANPQLACLIITEAPTMFGLTAGANTCVGATSQPIVGDVYTIAGSGVTTYSADNVLATSTGMSMTGVQVDAAGNVFLADQGNGRVRVVYQGGANIACLIVTENPTMFGLTTGSNTCVGATSQPTQGFVYTLAGVSTTQAYSGDGAIAFAAQLDNPQELAIDSAGDIFIATFYTSLTPTIGGHVRVIYNGGAAAAQLIKVTNPTVTTPTAGFIYTVAGNLTTEGGDGTLATSATAGILAIYSLHIDAYDNLYIADKTYGSTGLPLAVDRIRVVYNGTVASPNPLATLISIENPTTVPTAASVQPGFIYTVAGSSGTTAAALTTDGVLATASKFAGTYGVALDPAGDIIVSDRLNYTIRRISAATGLISTIAGWPSAAQGIASGSAQPSPGNVFVTGYGQLWGPWGIAVDSAGGLYTADEGANRIRVISSTTSTTYPLLLTPTVATGVTTAISPFIETNIGTPGSTLSIASDFVQTIFGFMSPANAPGISECNPTSTTAPQQGVTFTTPVNLASGASCSFGLVATPTNGGVTAGNADIIDNSVNLSGSGHLMDASVTATGVLIVLSTNPTNITGGNPTVLTATLTTTTTSAPVTSGTVVFSITGGATLGTATVGSTGIVSITTSLLVAPTTSITVSYYAGPVAPPPTASLVTVLTVSAKPATSITLATSSAAVNLGQSFTLTATVTSPTSSGAFTGTVTFTQTQGTTVTTLGTAAVNSTGVATLLVATGTTPPALPAGSYKMNASYGSDIVYANSSTTTSVTVVVTAPAYSVTPNVYSIAIQSGQSGAVTLTVPSVGGYTGTLTPGCGSLPSNVECSYSPNSLAFAGANNTQTMTVTISSFSLYASSQHHGRRGSLEAMLLWLPATLAGIFALRRKNTLKQWQRMSLLALLLCGSLVGLGSMTGCTNGLEHQASPGTFNVPITLSDGVTTPQSVTITVSILGNSSVY